MTVQVANIPIKIYVKDGFISGLCQSYSVNEEQSAGVFDGIYGYRDRTLELQIRNDGRYWFAANDVVSVVLKTALDSALEIKGIVTNNLISTDPDKEGVSQWLTIRIDDGVVIEKVERERSAIPQKNRPQLTQRQINDAQQKASSKLPKPPYTRPRKTPKPQPTFTLDHPRRLIDLE